MVSDTGQNRVFIWNQLPATEYAEPDVILGQLDTEETGRNSGGLVGADTLQYSSGLWSDGERLIVADAWNHRVLIWNSFPNPTWSTRRCCSRASRFYQQSAQRERYWSHTNE